MVSGFRHFLGTFLLISLPTLFLMVVIVFHPGLPTSEYPPRALAWELSLEMVV